MSAPEAVTGTAAASCEPNARRQWEAAASGWAKWEPAIGAWMEPATQLMLELVRPAVGSTVLDLACGAGSQTLRVARRVGPTGRVIAADIAEPMLAHLRARVRAAVLSNITTVTAPAEGLDLPADAFDACICRLGLMLFASPSAALRRVRRALRPHGRLALVVFTTPEANGFMAEHDAASVRRLSRRAGWLQQ